MTSKKEMNIERGSSQQASHGAHRGATNSPYTKMGSQNANPSYLQALNDGAVAKKRGFPRPLLYILLAIVIILAGVGIGYAFGGKRSTPVAEDTTVAEVTTVNATVKADGIKIAGPKLDRGTVVTNIQLASDLSGADKNEYYMGTVDGKVVYIPKGEVRLSSESDPEAWTGYATEGAIVYPYGDLTGTDVRTLTLNEEFTVLDTIGNVYFVRLADGYEGYIPADFVMREKQEEQAEDNGSSGGYSGNNYSGGGSSGGGTSTPVTPPTPSTPDPTPQEPSFTPSDGDDMSMPSSLNKGLIQNLFGAKTAYADESSDTSSKNADSASSGSSNASSGSSATQVGTQNGKVLKSNCQSYLAILNRGDVVSVKQDELFDFVTIDETKTQSSDQTTAETPNDTAAGTTSNATNSDSATAPISEEERDLLAQSAEAAQAGSGGSTSGISAEAETALISTQASTEDMCTVVVNDNEFQMEECLLHLEGTPAYTSWEGFMIEGSALYSDYKLATKVLDTEVNTKVTVIDRIKGVRIDTLVVQYEGTTYYTSFNMVSREEIAVEPEEEETGGVVPSYTPSYGGNSGGGNSGGSTPTPAPDPTPAPTPDPEPEWTPPAL